MARHYGAEAICILRFRPPKGCSEKTNRPRIGRQPDPGTASKEQVLDRIGGGQFDEFSGTDS